MINMMIKVLDIIIQVILKIQLFISKYYDSKLSVKNKSLLLDFHPYDIVMEKDTQESMDKKIDNANHKWDIKDLYNSHGRYIIGVVIGYEGLASNLPKRIKVAFINPDNFSIPQVVLKDPKDLVTVMSSVAVMDHKISYQKQLNDLTQELDKVLNNLNDSIDSKTIKDEDDNGGGFYH